LNEIKVSQKIAPFSSEYHSLLERITNTIEFDDIASEMNRSAEKLINDPEQLDLISQKLQVILICKENTSCNYN
jgi:DNA repair protein RecN (Recombination protein N)